MAELSVLHSGRQVKLVNYYAKVEFSRDELEKHTLTHDSPEKSKVLAKLVLEGQINSALRFLSETSTGGVLDPNPQPANLGSLPYSPIDDDVPESVFSEING